MNDEEIQAIFQPDIIEIVEQDYQRFKKMKEMDQEIIDKWEKEKKEGKGKEEAKGGFVMTDVVPVGGLIMAKFIFILSLFFFFFFNFCSIVYCLKTG